MQLANDPKQLVETPATRPKTIKDIIPTKEVAPMESILAQTPQMLDKGMKMIEQGVGTKKREKIPTTKKNKKEKKGKVKIALRRKAKKVKKSESECPGAA